MQMKYVSQIPFMVIFEPYAWAAQNKFHDLLISYRVIKVREQRSVKLNYMQIQIVFLVIADGCSLNVNTYDLERRQLGFSQTVVMNID